VIPAAQLGLIRCLWKDCIFISQLGSSTCRLLQSTYRSCCCCIYRLITRDSLSITRSSHCGVVWRWRRITGDKRQLRIMNGERRRRRDKMLLEQSRKVSKVACEALRAAIRSSSWINKGPLNHAVTCSILPLKLWSRPLASRQHIKLSASRPWCRQASRNWSMEIRAVCAYVFAHD